MKRAGIPLHDAPERYFDQEKWGELIRRAGNRAAALDLVNRPNLGDLFYLNDLAGKIRSEFKLRLIDESIVPTGCTRGSVEPVPIPGSRCRDLQPDFANDKLVGRWETFVDIRVFDPAELAASSTADFEHEKPTRQSAPGDRRRSPKLQSVKESMRDDIRQGRLTRAELQDTMEKELASKYSVSRDTARKARNAVLSETNTASPAEST